MKNLVLEYYKKQIENAQSAANAVIANFEAEAKEAFQNSMLFKKKELAELQTALDNSKQLTSVDDEFPHRYVHTDFSKLIDVSSEFEIKMLVEYLQEHMFIDAYVSEGYVTTAEGPCIVVNEDGDVLDQESGKWIISRKDYNTEFERNKLIEAHMEKTGCFSSVVQYSRYGVEGYVNTQEKST